MSKPFQIGLFAAGISVFSPSAQRNSAVSVEAKQIRKATENVTETLEMSFALFGPQRLAFSQLRAMLNESADETWDNEPISTLAVEIAEEFIRALPQGAPMPEFAPEPDGAISLDWIQTRNRILSLSIGPSRRLACAWLDGTDSGHAVVQFDGVTIPPVVFERIKGITGYANVAVGLA